MKSRGTFARFVRGATPLGMQFIATFLGALIASRLFHGPRINQYLLITVAVLPIGFFADWGHATSMTIRYSSNNVGLSEATGQILRRVLPIAVLTCLASSAALIVWPLRKGMTHGESFELLLLVSAGSYLINVGTILRQHLLAEGRLGSYYWSLLIAGGGVPLIALIGPSPAFGVVVAATCFVLQQLILLGGVKSRLVWTGVCLATRSHYRVDERRTAIGVATLTQALSTTVDLALVMRFFPGELLAYYGVSRFVQSVLTFAYRPLDGATPQLMSCLRGETEQQRCDGWKGWNQARREAFIVAIIGAMGVIFLSPIVTNAWLGRAGKADIWVAVFLTLGMLANLVTLERGLTAMARRKGGYLLRLSFGAFLLRFAVGIMVILGTGSIRAYSATAVTILLAIRIRPATALSRWSNGDSRK